MPLDHVDVAWPVGPHYLDWVGPPGNCEWVAFKVKSAEFHICTLEKVADSAGSFDRWVGVEMALDAALAAMSGAFDAAVAEVFEAAQWVYSLGGTDLPFKRTLAKDYRVSYLVERPMAHLVDDPEITYDISGLLSEIEVALKRTAPIGWLEELRRLRNRSTHHASLPRYIEARVGGTDAGTTYGLTVGGSGDAAGRPENPVIYLRATQVKLDHLLRLMTGLVDYLTPNGVPSLVFDQRAVRVAVPPAQVTVTAHAPQMGPFQSPAES